MACAAEGERRGSVDGLLSGLDVELREVIVEIHGDVDVDAADGVHHAHEAVEV